MIPRITSLMFLHKVPVPHTNEVEYAVDGQGQKWIAKREANMGYEALLAEALTWLLGKELGALMPDVAYHEAEGGKVWLSAYVHHTRHWFPDDAPRIDNLAQVGAMMALDVWVGNEARHARNILVESCLPHRDAVVLWAIDADEALVGHVDEYAAHVHALTDPYNHARGLPLALLEPHILGAAQRAVDVSLQALTEYAECACRIAQEDKARALAEALWMRGQELPRLVELYLEHLRRLR